MVDYYDHLAYVVASADGNDMMKEQLLALLPPAMWPRIFGVVRRDRYYAKQRSHQPDRPYIAVVLNRAPPKVLRFTDQEWLSDACIARICLEA